MRIRIKISNPLLRMYTLDLLQFKHFSELQRKCKQVYCILCIGFMYSDKMVQCAVPGCKHSSTERSVCSMFSFPSASAQKWWKLCRYVYSFALVINCRCLSNLCQETYQLN